MQEELIILDIKQENVMINGNYSKIIINYYNFKLKKNHLIVFLYVNSIIKLKK